MQTMNNDEIYMKLAMEQAQIAADKGEVPVGAVIIRSDSGEVVAVGHNTRETSKNALCHAELDAINNCCQKLGGWRLPRCTMYVTLEPCPMCAGAIINTRIPRVVIGATDPKVGAMGGVMNLTEYPWNHHPETVFGVLEEVCSGILKAFFKDLREQKKAKKQAAAPIS